MATQTETYLAHVASGSNRREAAIAAGFSGRKARSPGKLIESPELRRKMQIAFRRKGNPFEQIADVVTRGMAATLTAATKDGLIPSDLPDLKTQVQSAKVAADLMGITERATSASASVIVQLSLNGTMGERMMERMTQAASVAGGTDHTTLDATPPHSSSTNPNTT